MTKRVRLREAVAVLGISVDTYERRWRGIFTDLRNDAGYRLIFRDELEAAAKHASPVQARAAVLSLRARAKRT